MCLGATRWQTFTPRDPARRSLPALLTGFAMAFARAVGEYGSVIFIAGNMPMVSEITPLIIIGKLEQYDYAGATAVAAVMLVHLVRAAAGHQRAAGAGSASGREARHERGHRQPRRASASAPPSRPGCAGR